VQAGEGTLRAGSPFQIRAAALLFPPQASTSSGSNDDNVPDSWAVLPAISRATVGVAGTYSRSRDTRSDRKWSASDIINVIYADTTLVDTNGHWLNEFPIYLILALQVPGMRGQQS